MALRGEYSIATFACPRSISPSDDSRSRQPTNAVFVPGRSANTWASIAECSQRGSPSAGTSPNQRRVVWRSSAMPATRLAIGFMWRKS
jgi:hypothetical protein